MLTTAKNIGKLVLPKSAETAIEEKAIEAGKKFLESEAGQKALNAIEAGEESWNEFEQTHPNIAITVKGLARVSELIPAGKGFGLTKRGIKRTAGATGELVEEAVEKGVKKKIIKTTEEIDDLTGRITQGTKKEIKQARKALEEIDTTGVENFEDLKNLAGDSIGEIARKQDELLGESVDSFDLARFSKTVGDKEQNFVKRAMEQLKEVYDKTEDLVKLDEINTLEKKVLSSGITAQEINNLARRFSRDMPSGFSKVGDPLTSVNKVASENVRKGLKKDARSLLTGEASKALDDQMTNLFTLKRTAEKMEGAVQKLQNKVKKRGLFEKVARKAGLAIDVATFGTVRGFLTSFMPSNIGNKVLNSLDVEGGLIDNLKKIDRLNDRIDKLSDANAVSALAGILKNIAK